MRYLVGLATEGLLDTSSVRAYLLPLWLVNDVARGRALTRKTRQRVRLDREANGYWIIEDAEEAS